MDTIRTAIALALALGCAGSASAQGIYADIAPRPDREQRHRAGRIDLTRQKITGRVQDAAAEFKVEQVFHNSSPAAVEGTFLFPVPRGVVARGLSLTIDGKVVAGEILDRDTAGGVYRDIVRKLKDPALLEYVDQGLLRASIFPIGPNADVRIEIAFAAPAERSGDLWSVRLPTRCAAEAQADLTIDLAVETARPLTTVYSPMAGVDVQRDGDRKARVSYEGRPKARSDFQLYFASSDGELGMSVLTHRVTGQEGTFLLVLNPRSGDGGKTQPRDLVFVLDRSGSMAGEKWTQAVKALQYGLNTLHPDDRFGLVSFATDVRRYKSELVTATPDEIAGAKAHLEQLTPAGGTNIASALHDSLTQFDSASARLKMVAFLTDGLPTIGEVDPSKILQAAQSDNAAHARVFAFGLGYDVNTFLLDRLATDQNGASDYVEPEVDLEVPISAFFAKVREPALVDPVLSVTGAEILDVYPQKLPDLFQGASLLVAGRYKGAAERCTFTVKGRRGGGEQVASLETALPAEDRKCDFLPSLWAARKVGFLMNEIRLQGSNKELVDAVIALGKEYGIVTPYTSGLVVEEGMRAGRSLGLLPATAAPRGDGGERLDLAEDAARESLKQLGESKGQPGPTSGGGPVGPTTGGGGGNAAPTQRKAAVLLAKKLKDLGDADSASDDAFQLDGKRAERLRVSGRKLLRVGDTVIDGAYEESMKDGLRRIVAFSDEYFALLDEHPDLAPLFALGDEILFVLDGKAILIQPAE